MKLLTYLALSVCTAVTNAVALDITDKESICAAAQVIQEGEWNYYSGFQKGGTIGMFNPPYYWWNAGEAFGGLVDYFTFCDPKNGTLEGWILEGMFWQAGEQYNYIPANQSLVEGNDDQGVWGLTTMQAAERNFTNPEGHSWLSLTQAIYNTMNARWDAADCNGGLRWQIFTWNSGYDYKNSISNGCLFHIAARLARFTGNQTYADTAEKVWDWMESDGFLFEQDGEVILFDGAKIVNGNCTQFTKTKWSYTYGVFLAGAAYMHNFTGDDKWETRVQELVTASAFFFPSDNIMQETSCAPSHCNNDQRSFRSLFGRCLGLTASLVPSVSDQIKTWIDASAAAAAQSCSGGSDGVTCGLDWTQKGWDGVYGLGEQMGALETIQALLVHAEPAPYTMKTGGTTLSNPDAGLNSNTDVNHNSITVSGKDKAGAGIITAIALVVILAGSVWMIL